MNGLGNDEEVEFFGTAEEGERGSGLSVTLSFSFMLRLPVLYDFDDFVI